MEKQILDVCCGSKMFWFDKDDPLTLFNDIRAEDIQLNDRTISIAPDVMDDFCSLSHSDETFNMVVFDPPHLKKGGPKSWQVAKYGKLSKRWQEDLKLGFSECFRVLKDGGFLIFKWNETHIKVAELLELCDYVPLFGHPSGKRSNTHWICFIKSDLKRKES
ncbi:TPA: hypothetical protein ACX6QP_002106 [Photobacterium damselae]